LMNNSFDDKNGNRHYRTEIIADNINILTWKKTKDGDEGVDIKDIPEEEVEDEKIIEENVKELAEV